jgi:hypothetical protein
MRWPLLSYPTRIALALIALATLGCSPASKDETNCEPAGAVPSMESTILGRQDAAKGFARLEADDLLPLIRGPQGGHHLLLSVRFFGQRAGDWVHSLSLLDPDTRHSVGGSVFYVRACPDRWTVTHMIRAFVDTTTATRALIELETKPFATEDPRTLRDEARIRIQSASE